MVQEQAVGWICLPGPWLAILCSKAYIFKPNSLADNLPDSSTSFQLSGSFSFPVAGVAFNFWFWIWLYISRNFIVIFYATFVCLWSKKWVFPHKLILPFRQKSRNHFHKDSKVFKECFWTRKHEMELNNVRAALQWACYSLTPPIYPVGKSLLLSIWSNWTKREEAKFSSEWSPNNLAYSVGLLCRSKQRVDRKALSKQKVLDAGRSFHYQRSVLILERSFGKNIQLNFFALQV